MKLNAPSLPVEKLVLKRLAVQARELYGEPFTQNCTVTASEGQLPETLTMPAKVAVPFAGLAMTGEAGATVSRVQVTAEEGELEAPPELTPTTWMT
jgi:hypothetical protein